MLRVYTLSDKEKENIGRLFHLYVSRETRRLLEVLCSFERATNIVREGHCRRFFLVD